MAESENKQSKRGLRQFKKYEDDIQTFSLSNNSNIKTGVVTERWPQDVLCGCFFMAFCVGMVMIAWFGFTHGNARKLMAPLDKNNNFCGIGQYDDYSYLYITNATWHRNPDQMFETAVCVHSCPDGMGDQL